MKISEKLRISKIRLYYSEKSIPSLVKVYSPARILPSFKNIFPTSYYFGVKQDEKELFDVFGFSFLFCGCVDVDGLPVNFG
jgi:NADH:ubiquinone oxidoreductase subunit C